MDKCLNFIIYLRRVGFFNSYYFIGNVIFSVFYNSFIKFFNIGVDVRIRKYFFLVDWVKIIFIWNVIVLVE